MNSNSFLVPNGPLIQSDTNFSKSKVGGMLQPVTKLILPSYVDTDDVVKPVAGMLIFNTTTGKLNFYNGEDWEIVTSA